MLILSGRSSSSFVETSSPPLFPFEDTPPSETSISDDELSSSVVGFESPPLLIETELSSVTSLLKSNNGDSVVAFVVVKRNGLRKRKLRVKPRAMCDIRSRKLKLCWCRDSELNLN